MQTRKLRLGTIRSVFNQRPSGTTAMSSSPIVVQRDTKAWQLQVWVSFGIAVFLCAVGLAWLPGEQLEGSDEDLDPLFDEAVAFVVESRRGSTSSVQRRFKIGYNRAARIIDQMEMQGIVSPPGSNGQRDVLAPAPMRD